jgi:hypothetical protein
VRIGLRRGWRDDDLDTLAAINADPEVMRYILDGSVRETGELIGWAGLAVPDLLLSVMPAVETGWRPARPCPIARGAGAHSGGDLPDALTT